MTDNSPRTHDPSFQRIDPRLWMLISPALPVGGYSYSQGLEYAVHAGWITTADEREGGSERDLCWRCVLDCRGFQFVEQAQQRRAHLAVFQRQFRGFPTGQQASMDKFPD